MANKNGLGILLLLGLGYYFLNKKPSRTVIAKNGGGYAFKTNGGYAYQPVETEYFEEEVLPTTTSTGRRRTRRTLTGETPVSRLAGELAREQYMESVFRSITV
jgi:hypothetical protein